MRPLTLSLLAAACAFSVVSACSHKTKSDSENADASAATDTVAGTDAVPSVDAQTPNGMAGTAIKTASTNTVPHVRPKPKSKRTAKRSAQSNGGATATMTEPASASGGTTPDAASATAALAAQQAQAAQIQAQQQALAAAQAAQANAARSARTHSEEAPDRAPASAHGSPSHNADAATGEVPTEEGGIGGMIDSIPGGRSGAMALGGLALVAGGGFAFWKKKQALA